MASVAKTLMLDIFRPGLPLLVTAGFASGYVMSLSIANLSGTKRKRDQAHSFLRTAYRSSDLEFCIRLDWS